MSGNNQSTDAPVVVVTEDKGVASPAEALVAPHVAKARRKNRDDGVFDDALRKMQINMYNQIRSNR